MNQDNMHSDDDAPIRDACRNLREMEIPSQLKSKCLTAAQNGLASAGLTQSLPLEATSSQVSKLPVAIAASLLVGVGLGWILRGNAQPSVREDLAQIKPKSVFMTPRPTTNATSIVEYQERSSEESFFTKETYLCGVGRIQSKSKYQISREQQ